MNREPIETARRLMYLYRCAIDDIKSYKSQLEQMKDLYDLIIDYDNYRVYKKKN